MGPLLTDAVVVDTDTQCVGVQWSETSNSDDFSKNLIRARCEGRFLRPLGVVSCDLRANDSGGAAVFFSGLGRPTGPMRSRSPAFARESARSVNLRAIGAPGAAKRPCQSR